MPRDDNNRARFGIAALLVVLTLATVGCGRYRLQGKVVPGDESSIALVSPDDPRLERRGIRDVDLTVTLDPRSLGNEQVGSGQSDLRGAFALPVDAMAPGFLEHEVMIAAVKDNHETASRIMMLPSEDRRLLITLTEGRSEPPRRKGEALDEALEEARPYLERVK